MTLPKSGQRGMLEARERPFRTDHKASVRTRWERHPHRLRDLIRELQDAREAETVTRLHRGGVEWDAQSGGSKLGSPRWTAQFKQYVTGNDCDTTEDGDWRWPLRSSLFRLSISRSGTDRTAARFVYLLMTHRYHVRDAWAALCGPFADPDVANAAEDVALAWLTRWWQSYLCRPVGVN